MSGTLIDPCRLDRTGSFFKQLINTFASEIGELKQEMVQTGLVADRDPETPDMQSSSLEEDVSSLYLQEKDTKSSARDSGYDSLKRKLSILDRLILAHPVWLLLTLSDDETHRILQQQQPGIFLVRKSAKLQKKVISLRLGTEFGPSIRDFPIKESQYTFSLEGSGISFADLFRLIAFYCISRDVLPFTLRLPETIAAAKTQADLEEVAQLGVEFWNSPLYNKQQSPPVRPARPLPSDSVCRLQRQQQVFPTKGLHSLRTRTPSELECSQTKGALCFVNPLFLEVHRQGAGNSSGSSLKRPKNRDPISPERSRSPPPRPPPPRKAPPLGVHGKQVSMPETVSWIKQQQIEVDNMGAGPTKKAAPIPPPRFKKYMSFSEVEGSRKSQMGDSSISSQKLQTVVARNLGSAPGVEPVVVNANVNCPPPCLQEMVQQNRGGRQRLSDMSISTSSSDSLDYERSYAVPGGQGGDSSLEEDYEVDSDHESMAPPIKPKKKRSGSFVLPRIVKTQFRKVSGVFNSFMTPEKRMVKRIAEVSQDKRTYFGCLVQDYISFLQENKGCHVSGADMLQTIRQFMTQVKNYLAQSSELDPPIESLIPEEEIDVVLEKAMHKCILKPLKSHIEASLKDFQIASGSWKQLKENLLLAKQKKPQELGVDATAPDSVTIEKIRHKFVTMQKMYSPEKKVTLFLRVCKLIYTVMENNSGRMYGADDFLPMLTYVLAQCDMPELDTEIEYMMELLDPSLLHGEGGYYLTSAYGAMSLIKNFQEEQAARLLSSETRNTLHQWHRRRTTNRTIPTVDDFQNYLRVAFQEVNSGCTAKTLVVKPYATTEELCEVCADKFKVQDPSTYALFLITEETSQQLAPDTYPQKIKAEIHSRPQPLPFHFVYKRPTNLQICIPPDEENGNTFL
ncbi:ras and Rab interactor 2-like isoform X1 [Acipenser ruthenus]|nr:ras and Rab interactor 2-like isoform X1 [Acipenser ruthenus]XP_033860422.3 ras and Rab interactor 2-like isoform X1 [Acipenser ruthenus]XP_033860423.3 ras and Rab interactor 2-like isoform X1 [Acipenser ruthenus]